MKSVIVVRKYQDSDLEPCRRLWLELVEWHREIYSDLSIGGGEPELFFDKHLAKIGPNQIWVAAFEEKVIGIVGLIIDGKEAEMEPIIVSRAFRGQGVGKKLVERAVYEARRAGVKYLNVAPVARNAKAIQFLHSAGFKNLGHLQFFMDFSDRKWKPSLKLYECEFDY